MTEILPTNNNGQLGLFATRAFNVGDVIVREEGTLIRLAPTSPHHETQLCSLLLQQPGATRGNSDTSSNIGQLKQEDNGVCLSSRTLWESITPPSDLDSELHGQFRGMVQAALCYLFPPAKDQQQPQQQHNEETKKKFLELYYPGSITDSSPMPPVESRVVELAQRAMAYLTQQHGLQPESGLTSLLSDTAVHAVMLVWAFNSFEGGRIYQRISRINHSCNPNAVVQVGDHPDRASSSSTTQNDKDNDCQVIRAAAPIQAGEEITISYLGSLLYADRPTRQAHLRQTKHFDCACPRCCTTSWDDTAASIPCIHCHPRISTTSLGSGQSNNKRRVLLDEDVQYDDEHNVHYMYPRSRAQGNFQCDSCQQIVDPQDAEYRTLFQSYESVTTKVNAFLHEQMSGRETPESDKDEEELEVEREWIEQHLSLASSTMGARHYLTNLVMLIELEGTLQSYHTAMLSSVTKTDGNSSGPDMESIAQSIDQLERLCRFVDGLGLQIHRGHLLSNAIVGVARALVTLGDIKSQKYASKWLSRLSGYMELEPPGIQTVVAALESAWKRNDDRTPAAKKQKV